MILSQIKKYRLQYSQKQSHCWVGIQDTSDQTLFNIVLSGSNYRTVFLLLHYSIILIIVPLFGRFLAKKKLQIIVPF